MGETRLEAAKREFEEEVGLAATGRRWISLDAHATVPARIFRDWRQWGKTTYVVQELSFAAQVQFDEAIQVSNEHLAATWLSYEAAHSMLRFDSIALHYGNCILV